MKKQFKDVIDWQEEQFPKATTKSIITHLYMEVFELGEAVKLDSNTSEELADCFLLLFGLAHKLDLGFDQIVKAIEDKMKINKFRTWGEPDANGVVRHIKNQITKIK